MELFFIDPASNQDVKAKELTEERCQAYATTNTDHTQTLNDTKIPFPLIPIIQGGKKILTFYYGDTDHIAVPSEVTESDVTVTNATTADKDEYKVFLATLNNEPSKTVRDFLRNNEAFQLYSTTQLEKISVINEKKIKELDNEIQKLKSQLASAMTETIYNLQIIDPETSFDYKIEEIGVKNDLIKIKNNFGLLFNKHYDYINKKDANLQFDEKRELIKKWVGKKEHFIAQTNPLYHFATGILPSKFEEKNIATLCLNNKTLENSFVENELFISWVGTHIAKPCDHFEESNKSFMPFYRHLIGDVEWEARILKQLQENCLNPEGWNEFVTKVNTFFSTDSTKYNSTIQEITDIKI